MAPLRTNRILLKVSGEALGSAEDAFAHAKLSALAQAITQVVQDGIQVGLVIGAGNLFRGRSANLEVVARVTADHVGMLATIMNAAVMRDYLRAEGQKSCIFTPRTQSPLAEAFSRDRAVELLKTGHVLIFAGGTGSPYFTTDTAAALRALEISADVLLKGTQVDGVYDKDPRTYPDARRFDRLTYDEMLARKLRVLDLTAVTLCSEGDLPLVVFDISDPRNLRRLLAGESVGTWITKEPRP